MIVNIAPNWGVKRMRARHQAKVLAAAYEAAEPGRLRRKSRDYGSGNTAFAQGGTQPRTEARHLDRNHDIVRNGINTLVQNIVGAQGIGIQPQPRGPDGKINEDLVDQIQLIISAWAKRPEVTGQHDWASSQRLITRTWVRDGEMLYQELIGDVPGLVHSSAVPYSLELIEADLLPHDFSDRSRNILQGVERNAWNRPIAYHLYKEHPGDPGSSWTPALKRVSADRIRHVKLVDRIGQVRGVSILASVITRLEDLKDYEESERIAAKIAASMAAVIVKGDPGSYSVEQDPRTGGERNMRFQPGMVFDNLRPGESVSTIDTNRPNPNLQNYRDGQLRAAAGGMCVSFSSFSNNYNGTYTSQRQELVEKFGAYGVLAFELISQSIRPTYERLIATAWASGQLKVPKGYTLEGLVDALYMPPPMPWIQPVHEAMALRAQVRSGFRSAGSVIAERGGRMYDVYEQISLERAWANEKGIVLDTDPKQVSNAGLTQARAPGSTLPDLADTAAVSEDS
ncbi:hypothetical protein N789_14160 [Arenimonas oryziterrae DSM 21050 = YC6267]|uniref:Phage portal protein n=2 Tax=Arenimonas TaxID=490567 RepID=A0A091ASI7_9GAMM|nr:hypothetical protein N789_14160 [Arenimonas oryziterrae DSM 21050 = YC6267]